MGEYYPNRICPYYIQGLNHMRFRKYRNISTNNIKVQDKKINESKEYIKANLLYPMLSGIENTSVQENINNSIESDIMEFKKQMDLDAREGWQKAKDENKAFDPYIISTVYEITYNQNDIVSISIIYNEYVNKRNYFIRTSYNFNIKTGKSLSIGSLFKEGIDYQNIINNQIRAEILKNPQKYRPETIKDFEGIAKDQPFYLQNGNIVIYFGFHQIATSGADIPVITIPFSAFGNSINPKFLETRFRRCF